MTAANSTSENESPGETSAQDIPVATGRQGRHREASPRRSPEPRRRKPGSRALIDTPGPDPDASLVDVRLTIGVIAGTHGVNGELKLKVLTDHPEHIPTLQQVYLGESDAPTPLLGARSHGDQMLIRLEGVTTPEQGKLLGGLKVRIAATDAKPLEPGEYFLYQLIGLEARTEDGLPLGSVSDLIETGANDVLVITSDAAPELLVPNHPAYVLEIAPERNLIVIRPPDYGS